jgi:3,4-dehydroadipyl-CoA semialdehyde dehydrogenase
MRISSFLAGQWQDNGQTLAQVFCALDGTVMGEVIGHNTNMGEALKYARTVGGPALRKLTYAQRGQLLKAIAATLGENKAKYAELSYKNNGATDTDTFLDVEGGIGTLKYYASLSKGLGERHWMTEGDIESVTKDENFRAVHLLTPIRGVAVHINAFNFPAWGMLEKLAVSLLAGVPMLVKPATATLPVAYEMVKDIVAAEILPAGVLSLLAGGGRDLLDHITSQDAVAFTGSADTAEKLASHPRMISEHVRFNAEADSINSSILGPDLSADSDGFKSFIHEVSKEMTIKAGQKCTAVRRIFVPAALLDAAQQALSSKLSKGKLGDPKREGVTLGPLVSASQKQAAVEGTERLASECELVFEGNQSIDGDENGYYVTQKLMLCRNPVDAKVVHATEVFGPVSTLMPYSSNEELFELVRRGGGSLVSSIFTNDDEFAISAVAELASSHGRLLVVDDTISRGHSGHGNVMPNCNHGGPGRAGGGSELGGLRGLGFYNVRTAVQTNVSRAATLAGQIS